ncbi:hypothetical protein BN1723_010298 [Verticillium longisporum]|uniref:Uncharacterized protein n=1 Tax=Verticillium longisporum TaxID=100787 RepID=A0A0G4KWY4_VERLO|nr:hypothetical protein BN1723_010298 [Verticillium longisporum]
MSSSRSLGLGLGFGKTTALAAATLTMPKRLREIYYSGSSEIAVDNLVARVDSLAPSICARYSTGKADNNPSRV